MLHVNNFPEHTNKQDLLGTPRDMKEEPGERKKKINKMRS